MSASKKFAVDVAITLLASLTSMFLAFVISVLLGRYLGAEELGVYRLGFTLYGIVILVSGLGLAGSVIKFSAEHQDDRAELGRIVMPCIAISLIVGLVAGGLMYGTAGVVAEAFEMADLASVLRILSLAVIPTLVGTVFLSLLNGVRKMWKYAFGIVFQSCLMIVVSLVLLYSGWRVRGVAVGAVGSSAATCLLLMLLSVPHFKFAVDNYLSNAIRLIRFGLNILATNGVNLVYYQGDLILVGFLLTAEDVGYYSVAIALTRLFWIIPSAIQTISYPATSQLWSHRQLKPLEDMINKSMKYTALVLLPAGLLAGLLADEIVSVIFGPGFTESDVPMIILVVGSVIYGILTSVGGTLQGIGHPDVMLRIACITAGGSVILNLALIPIAGIEGAAIASTTSYVIATVLSIYRIKKVGIRVDHIWHIKAVSLFVIMLAIGEVVNLPTALVVPVLTFCLSVILLRFFVNSQERRELVNIIRETLNQRVPPERT